MRNSTTSIKVPSGLTVSFFSEDDNCHSQVPFVRETLVQCSEGITVLQKKKRKRKKSKETIDTRCRSWWETSFPPVVKGRKLINESNPEFKSEKFT